MSVYLWLKLVHVLAAIVAVGTNVTYFVWLRGARPANEHTTYVLRTIRRLDNRLANPAYVVLPITGILMVLEAGYAFETFWIAGGIVLYVVLGAVAGILFAPAFRRQVALAERGETSGAEYDRAAGRATATGAVTMIVVAAILILMVMKPS